MSFKIVEERFLSCDLCRRSILFCHLWQGRGVGQTPGIKWNLVGELWREQPVHYRQAFRRKPTMAHELCESRPLVGSSRNIRRAGLAASSTPIVSSFRCSTLRPSPGMPTTASEKSSMSSIFNLVKNLGISEMWNANLDYIFNVIILLLCWYRFGLPQHCAKPQRLTNC